MYSIWKLDKGCNDAPQTNVWQFKSDEMLNELRYNQSLHECISEGNWLPSEKFR